MAAGIENGVGNGHVVGPLCGLRFRPGRTDGGVSARVRVNAAELRLHAGTHGADGIARLHRLLSKQSRRLNHVRRRNLFVDVVTAAETICQSRKGICGTCHQEERHNGSRSAKHAARCHPRTHHVVQAFKRVERRKEIGSVACHFPAGAHGDVEIADTHHRKPQLNPKQCLEIAQGQPNAKDANDKQKAHHRRNSVNKPFKEGQHRSNRGHKKRLLGRPLDVSLADSLIDHRGVSHVAEIVVVPRCRSFHNGIKNGGTNEIMRVVGS